MKDIRTNVRIRSCFDIMLDDVTEFITTNDLTRNQATSLSVSALYTIVPTRSVCVT